MEKKQNAIDLTDLAVGILLLGIVVTIGARILVLFRDSRLTDLPQLTVANETNTSVVTDASGSEWELSNIWGISVSSCGNASNSSDMTAIGQMGAGNFTSSVDAGGNLQVTNLSMEYQASDWNCTYTHYDTTESQWALPNDAALGIAEYGNWFDIIVIVGVAGLILSLIFLAFGNRGESAGVSY